MGRRRSGTTRAAAAAAAAAASLLLLLAAAASTEEASAFAPPLPPPPTTAAGAGPSSAGIHGFGGPSSHRRRGRHGVGASVRPTPPPPSASSSALHSAAIIPRISPSSVDELSANGYVVIPDFLPPDIVSALRSDVTTLRSSGKFNVAKIGQDSTNALNVEIRVAETCFLGRDKLKDVPSESREGLYEALEGVRTTLSGNPTLDDMDGDGKAAPALDGRLTELLYAYYPRGGFYRRHRDAVPGSASTLREYSLLLYLNEDWKEEDGGRLRMHMDSGGDHLPPNESPNYLDVDPLGGTLVLFKSDRVPHEVLDTESERAAVVGWYNRPVTSADVADLATEEDKVRAGMLILAFGLVVGGLVSILT